MMNARLMKCAEFVQGETVCDVGTDHAQLPVFLVREGRVKSAIASDIREKPLEIAGWNIVKAGLSDKIRMMLSDGLICIPGEHITDIVIAGMGGETIIHILKSCPWSLKHKNLILQPMTKHEVLRKWLFENGFEIQKEECVPDKQFLYTVMQVQFTDVPAVPDWTDIYFGKMDLSKENGLAYAGRVLTQLRKAGEGSQNSVFFEIISKLEEKLSCL